MKKSVTKKEMVKGMAQIFTLFERANLLIAKRRLFTLAFLNKRLACTSAVRAL